MGRAYLGAGSSIGASFVFAYVGAKHAVTQGAGDPVATDRRTSMPITSGG
jgi:hypothetical protein